MLHGRCFNVLDELNEVATASDVEQEKRLIQFADPEAVSKARETLPARMDS